MSLKEALALFGEEVSWESNENRIEICFFFFLIKNILFKRSEQKPELEKRYEKDLYGTFQCTLKNARIKTKVVH